MLQEVEARNYIEGNLSSMTGNGEYTYSKELNTCLYANNILAMTAETIRKEYFIIDLATNNTLASWTIWEKGCDDCGMNTASIDAQDKYQDLYDRNFVSK